MGYYLVVQDIPAGWELARREGSIRLWEDFMFTLSDVMVDEIMFAMENQDLDYMIEAEMGTVVPMNEDSLDSGFESLEEGADLIPPPEWTSEDGFSLMSAFASGVGDPQAHTALADALSRGRGVFRAFKKTLENWPELEQRWFDYKRSAMARRVSMWYDEARVARGLERLGPEPEDDEDLLANDYSFRVAGREAWNECLPLFRQGLDEALSTFPEPLVDYEYTTIEREISEGGRDGLIIVLAESVGGAIAGVAVA
ncbi:MAG: hypothetical protein JXM71_01110, partial [Spirochaetales bacterium]|nr:hypothetical protein [Spirochaetales bacterium]